MRTTYGCIVYTIYHHPQPPSKCIGKNRISQEVYFLLCHIVATFVLYCPNIMDTEQLKRIADAIEEILRLVKKDMEKK